MTFKEDPPFYNYSKLLPLVTEKRLSTDDPADDALTGSYLFAGFLFAITGFFLGVIIGTYL